MTTVNKEMHVQLDGESLSLDEGKTIQDYIIQKFGRDQSIAAKMDGTLVDLSAVPNGNAVIERIQPDTKEGLEVLRHSTAHLLAHAVKQLFPETQVIIGPVIDDGFYYDFYREESFTPSDLHKIEQRMRKLVKRNIRLVRTVCARNEAIDCFQEMGEDFKVRIIKDIPEDETLTLYQQEDFTDLCRGPHVPSTAKIGAFKLTKISGSYWRGDAQNEQLQRIYGTAWPTQERLEEHLNFLEEQQKRDHRKIAQVMDLFHLQPEAPGMIFWHENGWTTYRLLQLYMRRYLEKNGYREINTPLLVNRSLWEASGHWDKFQDSMFSLESEKQQYAIKPMSCPCHVQVFKKTGVKSYRELPLRLSEFGHVHRYEPSGTLHGMMRVRSFVQDDGHIFCEPDQIAQETSTFIDQTREIYRAFGFADVQIRFSTRPEKRVGSEELWDKSEEVLRNVLESKKDIAWELAPGEGAFYGPKLEFSLIDCLKRVWQCGTIQLDFSMPERLGAHYIDREGVKQTPVMLHRAVFGSFERFLGILLESTYGWLPFWLAPVQVVCLNITDEQSSYVEALHRRLRKIGVRSQSDLRQEKMGYKIREHTIRKVPFLLICGNKEIEENKVTMRVHGQDQKTVTIDDALKEIQMLNQMPIDENKEEI